LLLSSKAGWICLLLFALYFFRWLVLKKNIISALLMMGLLISSFLFLNVYFTPNFSTRIPKASAIIETIKGNNIEHKKITTSTDGNGRRILVWKAATEIIIENFWIGVGTGDAKDKMLEKYQEKGMVSEYENKLNSHNQYLNTFIAIGIIGFVILLLCFLLPLYFSYKEKTFLFAAFVCITGINFLVESMLETQVGVIFYAFFYTLLCFSSPFFLKPKIRN
jgi:O-antigen ligase